MLVPLLKLVLLSALCAAQTTVDNSTLQPYYYLLRTAGQSPGIVTTSSGAPIREIDAEVSLNRKFLHNENLVEGLSHVVAELLPERANHGKGAGAAGYFEVTHDITDISKASMFSEIGKITPVRVRFSSVVTKYDTGRDIRGYAVKFYTDEGNFDIVGFNIPVMFFNEPLKFVEMMHMAHKDPVTGVPNPNTFWDWTSLNPEFLFAQTITMTDLGTPASYRYMPGYGLHTYQVSNANNEISFVRFHFVPANETYAANPWLNTLNATTALTIGAQDLDYLTRDLYNGISAEQYGEWIVSVQKMSLEDVQADPSLFDITRLIPTEKFPLHPVGKMVLNQNPTNYFREVEQLQFNPGNVVPGIKGAPDKVFESRAFAYRLSGNYRLGINFNNIDVNYPFKAKPLTYLRDGIPPVLHNGLNMPNYYHNSWNGPVPSTETEPDLINIVETPADNTDQISEFWENLPEAQKVVAIENLAGQLSYTLDFIRERTTKFIYENINEDYGQRLASALGITL